MIDRLHRLREATTALGADGAIITHPANRHYFSGFPAGDHAPDESSGVLVVLPDSAVLFTSPTNLPWAENTVRHSVVARPWSRPWSQFLGEQLESLGVRRVAFEDRALSVADHAGIIQSSGESRLIPAGEAYHALRAAKDEQELERIAEAARITDAAFVAVTTELNAGVTEREVAWRIESAIHELGGDGPGFPVIVAAGLNSARPHHDPSDRPLQEGEPVVIDMGARVGGYTADLTRTICLGEAPPEFTARYNTVLTAQRRALSSIRAGMSGRDADMVAREDLTNAGLGEQFVHGLGHGVGLLIHEVPSLGKNSEDILAPGQVITVEPGIYFENWGGIRIEDLCVVTATGLDVLSAAPK
ncbi:MAG: aminopeptidase P family protein [Chloroflexi bacterium]|nr:aminopeptidase P family protein [Chloroflexota bacterium]